MIIRIKILRIFLMKTHKPNTKISPLLIITNNKITLIIPFILLLHKYHINTLNNFTTQINNQLFNIIPINMMITKFNKIIIFKINNFKINPIKILTKLIIKINNKYLQILPIILIKVINKTNILNKTQMKKYEGKIYWLRM